VIAKDPFCSVLTTTQPKSFGRLVKTGDISSGFLNRWLFVTGTYKKKFARGSGNVKLDKAIKLLSDIHGWSGGGRRITWSKEGGEAYDRFFREMVEPLIDPTLPDVDEMHARLHLISKKLCLLLTINLKLLEIPVEVIEHLKAMWPYVLASYGVASANITRTEESEVMETLLRIVSDVSAKGAKEGPSQRELGRTSAYKKLVKEFGLDRVKRTLENMVQTEMLAAVPVKKKTGPATLRYRLA
jgi:hypothetical protein